MRKRGFVDVIVYCLWDRDQAGIKKYFESSTTVTWFSIDSDT